MAVPSGSRRAALIRPFESVFSLLTENRDRFGECHHHDRKTGADGRGNFMVEAKRHADKAAVGKDAELALDAHRGVRAAAEGERQRQQQQCSSTTNTASTARNRCGCGR